MPAQTPIERAVAIYCEDWESGYADESGIAKVNPETLGDATSPDFKFRYIDITSVTEGVIDWSLVEELRFGDAPSRARRVLRHGDAMVCTVRPLLGSHAFADWPDDHPSVCSTGFAVVHCENRLLPNFLKHLLFAEQTTRQLVAWQCGTSYPAVNERDIRRLNLPIPSKDEQARIARIFDSVDELIERTRAALKRAREVKLALVQRIFTEGLRGERQKKTAIGLIPSSWEAVPVKSVVQTFQYGLSVPMEQKGKMPILRMGNIQDGEVVFQDLKYVNLPEKIVEPYVVRRGDVLFNRTNSQELVGKVGIFRHDAMTAFASYLIRLLVDKTKWDSYYLGHVLGSYPAQCRIKRYATPGVQQVNINATNLGKVLIPVPQGGDSLTEQREIAAILEAVAAVVRSYDTVHLAQQVLKKSLMHDLLSGRVRVMSQAEAAP